MNIQKSKQIICFFLFFLPFLVFSQNQDQDSVQVVGAKWASKEIQAGVIWHQGHFDQLFQSVQEINWVEIDLNKYANRVHIAADSKNLKTTSTFAQENNALVAINASFFNMKQGGSVDYLKVKGQVIQPTEPTKPNDRANAVFSIDNKTIRIEQANKATVEESAAKNIMVAGPLLVEESEIVLLKTNPFNNNRHPRTAVGKTADNKLILLVVDGRNSQAHGMSLIELSKLLKWLGAKDAMNLDGGGSSTLYIKNVNPQGIVNYPSDNKSFDHNGQRPVANIIFLKE